MKNRKAPGEKRKDYKIRLSAAEYREILCKIPEDMCFGVWARQTLLGQEQIFQKIRRQPPLADPQVIGQLGRIGNNLNQIARVLNIRFSSVSAACLADELTTIRHEIMTLAAAHSISADDASDENDMSMRATG